MRELGQEKFSGQVFSTDPHEILDPKEWAERDGVTTSGDAAGITDDLLTREERELNRVKRAEEEERHGTSGKDIGWGGGTGKPGAGGSVGMKMKMDEEVQSALKTLGEDGHIVQLVRPKTKCKQTLISDCIIFCRLSTSPQKRSNYACPNPTSHRLVYRRLFRHQILAIPSTTTLLPASFLSIPVHRVLR